MYQELGASIFSGVAIMVLAIPTNIVIASISRKYQLEQMQNKDKRVKLMNEILSGVKVLKLYGWEPSFIDQVHQIRDCEIKVLKKAAWLNAFSSFIWTSLPFAVALASFATYVLIDDNNILDAKKAFVTLSYLNIMR
jgi:ABC-type multidrug transport system fused ATPase/permease subunit